MNAFDMKKVFFVVTGMLVSIASYASIVKEDSIGKGYKDYSVWDNTYIGLNAGVSAVINGDNASKLGRNLSPLVNLNAGMHFSPYFGGRVQAGYARQKAWANNYNTTFAQQSGLYQFKMNLFTVEADVTADLLNLIKGYKPGQPRFFSLYPIVGAGWAHTMANRTNSDDLFFTVGVIGNFKLNDRFDLNVEWADKFMPAAIEGWYNGHPCHNYMSLTVGVAYKLRNRGYRLAYAPQPDYTAYEASLDELNKRVRNLQKELDAKNAEIMRLLREKGVTAIPDMSVFFHLNSAKITKEGELILAQYAEAIKETPNNVTFELFGYCDLGTGARNYNEKLKMKRAYAVADMLISKFGVPANKLIVKEGNLENPPYPQEADKYSRVVILEVKK